MTLKRIVTVSIHCLRNGLRGNIQNWILICNSLFIEDVLQAEEWRDSNYYVN